MMNLYRETAQPAVPTPPLDGDASADVVVVGAGFTGLSTSLHLAEKGVRTVLLETEEPGWGASGRNGGQVNPGLKFEPEQIEMDFGKDLGERMNELSGNAPAFVFDLVKRHGIDCEARQNGTLRAAVRTGQVAQLRSSVERWRRRGAPVELVQGGKLAAMIGHDRYPAALWDRRGGDLNPLSYARGLARAALAAGATIHGRTRVLNLKSETAGWRVETASGTVTAQHVVLATNGYTDDLWPTLRRSVVPLFGAMAATSVLPEGLASKVMAARTALYEIGAITVYYRVDGGGRLLIGGRGPQREITHTSAIRHLLSYASRLWPELRDIIWTHAWGGRLAMTRDHYPHVHEPARGLHMSLGYNGRGVAMASAMGAQLAARIVDPRGPFPMPVTNITPIGLHRYWPLAVRAAILRGRMIDWLGLE
jgi:glycine/D-amino acid oxidase-like deaminating enzyme